MMRDEFRPGAVPAKPGVYVYRDRFGKVIYVGKASNLRRRMSHYFQPSQALRADPKLRSLINSIDSWEFFVVKNEDEALILESKFIKEYAPHYNILLRDDKRYPFLRIDPNEAFPRLKLTRIRKKDSCLYFGPFPHGSALKSLMEFLTKRFSLRSCKTDDPGPEDRKHCLAGTVRDCCRPCTGETSPEEYRKRLDQVISILNGNIREFSDELKQEMMKATEKRQFEKAAKLRDILDNLQSICGVHTRSFEHAAIPAETGMEAVRDLQKALRLPSPPRVIVGFDISNLGTTFAVASLVRSVDGRPDKAGYRRFRIKTVQGQNDFAMMNEVVTRYFSRLLNEKKPLPDLLMVDGGKGQLGMAVEALAAIDCPPFPVIGLAKRNEEIYLPGRSEPVVLDRSRPALKVLQALRDEAHRFAVSYNRLLRLKRISESLLDEIPGLGEVRRNALLREFGSVGELRKASPEEIIRRVSGIGPEFALRISEFLKRHKTGSVVSI